jgi:carbonic anhydrase/acetyltransferase-like protein (isoleucine patch superfamily)
MSAPVFLPYRGVAPTIADDAFVAPNTSLIGDVRVGAESSIWFGTTLRGDVQPIVIGARTSIQDNSVVHATDGWTPTIVGDDCVVGHRVILHGCTLGDRVLVGMGAIVMDGVEVGDDVLIGAGAILTPRTKVPSGTMVLGAPGKVKRDLTGEERASILAGAKHYAEKTREYRAIVGG